MANDGSLAGDLVQYDIPDWRPLYDIIGVELADWFMWMHEIELADGARVHAYKHISTRCYFHLAHDGRAFAYTRGGRYAELARSWAIHLVFDGWEDLASWPEDPAEAEQSRAALQAAIRRAVSDEDEREASAG
jgi:hypothetical protein